MLESTLIISYVIRLLMVCTLSVLLILPDLVLAKPAAKRTHFNGATLTPLTGLASFYGAKFHAKRTANGERFDNNALTAAHTTLPFGSRVRVINARNGLSVIVRINDRGPFVRGRIIDLSKAAAKKLGLSHEGTLPVRLEILH
jgi:rare lipoprotein A